MYISLDRYAKAVKELRAGNLIDNGFMGLLCILKSVAGNQTINPKESMVFSQNEVSKDLNSLFMYQDIKVPMSRDEQQTLLLSEDYTHQVLTNLLNNSKVPVLALSIIFLHDRNLSEQERTALGLTTLFYRIFHITDEAKTIWFEVGDGSLQSEDFTQKRITATEVVSNGLNGPEYTTEYSTSFAPSLFFKKRAGDWGASSFIQKYKPTAAPSEYAAVLHSTLFEKFITTPSIQIPTDGVAKNIIYSGAPGTGKSFTVLQKTGKENREITVFHPEYQYSDFVGYLRPVSRSTGDLSSISYEFNPGPFTRALVKAYSDANTHYYLVIEELNRAMAAAVFGELFQLLDRNPDGSSSYAINLADNDLSTYIDSQAGTTLKGEIKLPGNLSIFATMNSSDQSVMPLDTAFKRRWQFKYLPINYERAPHVRLNLPIQSPATAEVVPLCVTWKQILKAINMQLLKADIPEDRLLGQFYLSEGECSEDDVFRRALNNKVFMYLWDDVLRHKNKSEIFRLKGADYSINTFSDLQKHFEDGSAIFSENIEEQLSNNSE